MQLTECPEDGCDMPAEVLDRYRVRVHGDRDGTPCGWSAFYKLLCLNGHHFDGIEVPSGSEG